MTPPEFVGCLLAAIVAVGAGAGEVLHEWTFDGPDAPVVWPHRCTVQVEDGRLHGEIADRGSDAWVWLPEAATPAPACLVLRLRTDETLTGRGEAYIKTRERPDIGLHSLVRFPLAHDGRWHEVRVPLPAVGTIVQLRLAVGRGPGTFDIDRIRLESDPYPDEIVSARAELPEEIGLDDGALSVTIRPREHRYEVLDHRCGSRWEADASGCRALLIGARRAAAGGAVLDLYDHSTRTQFTGTVSLPEPGAVSFDLECGRPEAPLFALADYPPMFTGELDGGRLVFCDRSAGVYVDQTEEAYANRLLTVYGNTSTTNLPLVGVVEPSSGRAMMALVETPCDAFVHLAPDSRGRHWPQVVWQESLATFGYPRRLSYRFAPLGGYVALAGLYRDYAAEQGRVMPFREKVSRRPAVALLKGAPILWGARDSWRFIRQARTEGMIAGVLANAQHGLWDDASLRRLNALGYLTAPYDNISDALEGPTGFQRDSREETAVHPSPGAGPAGGWEDELHRYFMRSSAFALRALQSYVPADLERYGYNAWFVDVALAIQLSEDWHPRHTFDRRRDLEYRRGCFDWLREQGLVIGAEHGNDWGIELVDWTEGSLGGPFWWTRARAEGWDPGRLKRAVSPEDYTDNYLRIGHGYRARVPFWQLVYHDCVVSTWYWGDGPDFHYDAAPEVSDHKDLQGLLYGGVPILWRGDEGYGWERNRERLLRSYRDTCLFHREVAFARLLDHEFLSSDGALQRTRFDSGHTAAVNFAGEPRVYRTEEGEALTLAPLGYYVTGPGFSQTRLWVDGGPVKSIRADGYLVADTPRRRSVGPVELEGRFVAFRTDPDRWQLALEPGGSYRFRTADLTGWDPATPCALLELDPLGATRRVVRGGTCGDEVAIDATPDARFFALVSEPDPTRVVVYPAGDELPAGESVILSVPADDATIRYTLDGSEPRADSPRYRGPFAPDRSAVVRARPFSGPHPLGQAVSRDLRSVVTLFASPLLRGGDDALPVDVPVHGLSQLRLTVGDGGDHCWSDWANWADAAFILEDGAAVFLSDLDSLQARQTYHEITRDGNPTGSGSIRINGRGFDKGLCCFSESVVVCDVPAGARRFRAWVGVDDRANPGPGGPEILRGSVTFSVIGLRP